MDPLLKALLNSLRCPICRSGIDLIEWSSKAAGKQHNYSCSSNVEHYRLFIIGWDSPPMIQLESSTIYDGKFQFQINQLNLGVQSTEVLIREVDPEHRVLDKIEAKRFFYEKKLFDFSQTNLEKILNRVKTILVFQ